jgi:hypothetical protein
MTEPLGGITVTVPPPASNGAPPVDAAPVAAPIAPLPDPPPVVTPTGHGSPLASLRARREALQEKLYLDLKVPRWDDDGGPAIYVRYNPSSPAFLGKTIEKAKKLKPRPDDWMVNANADALIQSCVGVFAIEDGTPPEKATREQQLSLKDGEPTGDWTRFDPDLGFSLGVEGVQSARAVVRRLYLTEGDLLAAANKLVEWSGVAAPEADEDFFTG